MPILVHICILIQLSTLSGSNCKLWPDGSYRMKQAFPTIESKDRLDKNYQIQIKDGGYLLISADGTKSKGNLLWLYNGCTFRLKEINPEKPDPDKLEGMVVSSFGQDVLRYSVQTATRFFSELLIRETFI